MIEDFYGLNELEYEESAEAQAIEVEELINPTGEKFDLEYAAKLLRAENVQDLVCIRIPAEINYADFMVVGTCMSDRHLNSVFISLNKRFKALKDTSDQASDQFLRRKIGRERKWSAIDLGNIVVHLFLPEYRQFYDLESLWTCGSEFDERLLEFNEQKRLLEARLDFLEIKSEEEDQNNNKSS